MPTIATIVIGRNEGERLARCLASIPAGCGPVVYVDSGSTDGSQGLAASRGAKVVMLDSGTPFTAARARNVGFADLVRGGEVPEFVQFVDGDCELEAGWFGSAAGALSADAGIGVVCGHLREREPQRSIFNRLADIEWRRPTGDVGHCGGIFMMRSALFERLGGFDPLIAAGEEPEFCSRVRGAGERVVRIDTPMARHDLAMSRFSQWWRRSVRGGYGALQLTLFGPPASRGAFRRQVRSVVVWAVLLPAAALLAAAACASLQRPVLGAGVIVLGLLLLVAQGGKISLGALRGGTDPTTAAWHGFFSVLWKYAAACGFARCLLDRLRSPGGARVRVFHKASA